jgi:hypothetical protein
MKRVRSRDYTVDKETGTALAILIKVQPKGNQPTVKLVDISNIDPNKYTLLFDFLQCANGADSGEERAKVREDDLLHEAKLLLQSLRLYC